MYHLLHVSAGHVVSLQFIAGNGTQSSFMGLNHGRYDDVGRHVTDAHQEQLDKRNLDARYLGREPEEERYVVEKMTRKMMTPPAKIKGR